MLLVSASSYAWADSVTAGLEVQCDQYQMRIRDLDVVNGQPGRPQSVGTTVYYDHQPHKASCVVNNHKVALEFRLVERTGGECGGAAGGLITLKIDDGLIVKDALTHSCSEGTTEIGVSPRSPEGYELEICGHTMLRTMPAFRGCVSVSSVQLRSIKKPLDRFFPVGDLLKLVKFPR